MGEGRGDGGGEEAAPLVLVVEDQALIAMLLQEILADAGFRAAWLPDGRRAARGGRVGTDGGGSRGAAASPAAAVVDLALGEGLDGREVIRRLRARRPDLPVAVVTGYGADAPQADLRGLGGPMLRLAKPFSGEALVRWLRAILGGEAPAGPAPAPRRRRRSDTGPPDPGRGRA